MIDTPRILHPAVKPEGRIELQIMLVEPTGRRVAIIGSGSARFTFEVVATSLDVGTNGSARSVQTGDHVLTMQVMFPHGRSRLQFGEVADANEPERDGNIGNDWSV